MTPQRTAAPAHRSVERQVEIAAPPGAVWKALTDAEELVRWFPLEARVTPGPAGSIWMRWDAADELDDASIETWEPEHHLRVVGLAGSWIGIATDYYLEGRSGGTVLRVVSSGFGEDDASEDLLQGFGAGWDFELRGLRHYLERHRGRDRVAAWARTHYSGGYEQAWSRLTGPGGWFGAEGLPAVEAGGRCSLGTPSGDRLEGVVQLRQPSRQFAATVEGWNDALFRTHLYGGVATIWLSTYGVSVERLRVTEREWRKALIGIFPGA